MVSKLSLIGIDVGFGFTKVCYFGNKEGILFPSIYSDFRERIHSIDGANNPLDSLIMELDGKKYLVGNIAKNESGSATFDIHNQTRHIICMVTGVALATDGDDFKGAIVLGLPISDLQNKGLIQQLKGTYRIKLNDKPLVIEIEKIMVVPQGAAGFYDIILSDEGKVVSNLSEKQVGIIDIGEKTLDFVCMNSSQFISEESGSLNFGMSKAYKRLQATIQKELGISCLPYQVKQYFSKVPNEVGREYRRLSNEIVDNISNWWTFNSFDKIYLAGGGGIALQKYISERIKCDIVSNSQFSNARGYLKCGTAVMADQDEPSK